MDHPQATSSRIWQKQFSWLGYNSVLVLVWLVLWQIAGLMEYAPSASIWYPPAALSLAAFIILGARAWPAIIIAVTLSTWWVLDAQDQQFTLGLLLGSALVYTVAHGGSYFAGAIAARRILAQRETRPVHATLTWLLFIAAFSALMSALIGTVAVWSKAYITSAEIPLVLATWWFGDAAAVVILTPIFMLLLGKRYAQIQQVLSYLRLDIGAAPWRGYWLKLTTLLAVFILSLWLLDTISRSHGDAYMGFAAMLILLPQLWIALSEPPIRTALSLSVLFLAVALAVGVFDLRDIMVVVQLALLTSAMISWLVMLIPMLASDNRNLNRLANIDQLTGALLRHAFLSVANDRLAQQRDSTQSSELTLLMFDIDNFKRVNDQHGHSVGDHALQLVAEHTRHVTRHDDVFGRFGGDEFLLLLNGNQDDGLDLSRRLQQQLQAHAQTALGIQLSLSFGITELSTRDTLHTAIEHADALLYKAKRDGRGRAALAGTATTKALS